MPVDTQLLSTAVAAGSSDYPVKPTVEFRLKAVSAEFTDNGAAVAWLPAVVLISDSGHVIARALDTSVTVAAGGSADVSFFPRGRRVAQKAGPILDYNVGEIGNSIATTLGTTGTVTASYQQVFAGDGILILAMAPSVPSLGATPGIPASISDSAGNTYSLVNFSDFEASPANVNEGVFTALYFCQSSLADLAVGSGTFTATWDNPVFDRVVSVWTVRHKGGADVPLLNNSTPDSDAAVFAATDVTLPTNDINPLRDQSLLFALIIAAKAGGLGGFSSVAGFNGFFQALSRAYAGSKQAYLVNPQTHGADAYLIAGAVPTPFEDDVGVLDANVPVPGFNGVGQNYANGANAWKGIILLFLD